MTTAQKITVGPVSFYYSDGKADLLVDNGTYERINLTIEDVETIAEFLNGIVRNYHVRDYRFNEVVRE